MCSASTGSASTGSTSTDSASMFCLLQVLRSQTLKDNLNQEDGNCNKKHNYTFLVHWGDCAYRC